ncbi:MAG: hypothetical protein ACI8QS_000212 [Planctomycetota bacterium]|jgi:hypothetical protein
MKKLPYAVAGAVALACFALPGSIPGIASQAATPATLSQSANNFLGLGSSSIGDVNVLGELGQAITVGMDIPGAPITLQLYPQSVRSDIFEVRAQVEDGSWVDVPHETARTYGGSVVGDPGSRVAASWLSDGVHARILLSNNQEFWIEPLAGRVDQATAQQHVLYRTEDVISNGGTCDADLLAPVSLPGFKGSAGREEVPGTANAGNVTAELGCDADFEFFSNHGSGTQARIESVINAINLQYLSDVGITHSITTILIRTTSNDPYSRKGASQLLDQFRNEWTSNQAGIQRDVAHLFTGKSLAGSTIGIAYVGVVCNSSFGYGLVESDNSSNFAFVTDLSAHELGHNWGASHCSCTSFTMNAFITGSNDFEPNATIPTIIAYRDAQTCFGGGTSTTGTVAGTVTDASNGSPIAGAAVQVDSGQSGTTAGDGSYSIANVPTGSRTVTASALGFIAQNAGATVSDSATTTVDFALDAAPVGSQAIVESITSTSTGGGNSDKHIFFDIRIVDDGGNPVVGASVSISVDLDGALFGTGTATTDSNGVASLNAKNSPNGCYETDVTGVSAAGLTFDGAEPANGFAKGSDSTPDVDSITSSDPCFSG